MNSSTEDLCLWRTHSFVDTRSIPLPSDPATFEKEMAAAGITPANHISKVDETLAKGRKEKELKLTEKRRVKKRRRGNELRTNAHLKDDVRFKVDNFAQ